MSTEVAGYCPMGCGQTLRLDVDSYVACSSWDCPDPLAVYSILTDPETEHIVTFYAETFTVKHPLRERVDDELLDCELGTYLEGLAGPPVSPGRYRVRSIWRGASLNPWVFERLGDV